MDVNAIEDNSMSERILSDIDYIIRRDDDLKEFCIVPINENKNKSPVLYEEHNLGLESWCVKYVYRYLYEELFKVRTLLRRNRLTQQKIAKLDKLLVGALLIHPDVLTFWNMRRELFEYGEINMDRELLLTKLVLSHKSKSNEAFAYRKWILNRQMKTITKEERNLAMLMLEKEFTITEMAAEKSQSNYHAWSHRIWSMQNIIRKNSLTESLEFMNIILNQLDFSMKWINKHISEHTGFHYRQYLCKIILSNTKKTAVRDVKYHCLIEPYVGIKFSNCNDITYLNNLLGKRSNINAYSTYDLLKSFNCAYFFTILLYDLFYFIEKLNEDFCGHESIWYHRRFVVFHLLKYAYDYHDLTWKRNVIDFNLINKDVNNPLQDGEKYPKIFKYEMNKVESSYLYKLLVESENKFIKKNSSENCGEYQKELALQYEKWLKFVLCLNRF